MNEEKIKGIFSIAKKGNYVIIGADKLKNYKKKVFLILASKSSGKTIFKLTEKFKDIVLWVENLEELVLIDNCKIVGIKNKGISDLITENLRSKEFDK